MSRQGLATLRDAVRRHVFSELMGASGWLLAGSIVGRLSTVGAAVAVSRIVVPRDFGELTVLQGAIALLGGFAGLGLSLAVTRQIAQSMVRDRQAAGRYIGGVLILTAAGGAIVTCAYIGFAHFFATEILRNRELTSLVPASAGAIVGFALTSTIQSSLVGLEDFRAAAFLQWLQSLATAAGLVAGAADGDVRGALIGFSIAQALAAAGSFALLLRACRSAGVTFSYRLQAEERRALWALGAPVFAASSIVSGAILAGQIILSTRSNGYAQVGIFALAYRWHLAILFIPGSAVPALLPMMTRLRTAAAGDTARSLFRTTIWVTVALAAVGALIVAGAAHLLLSLSGAFYARHTLPLIVLAATAVPSVINNVLSATSISVGALREWLLSDVVLAAVLIGIAIVLVGDLGATGLALAYLAAYLATDLTLAVPLRKYLGASGARG